MDSPVEDMFIFNFHIASESQTYTHVLTWYFLLDDYKLKKQTLTQASKLNPCFPFSLKLFPTLHGLPILLRKAQHVQSSLTPLLLISISSRFQILSTLLYMCRTLCSPLNTISRLSCCSYCLEMKQPLHLPFSLCRLLHRIQNDSSLTTVRTEPAGTLASDIIVSYILLSICSAACPKHLASSFVTHREPGPL